MIPQIKIFSAAFLMMFSTTFFQTKNDIVGKWQDEKEPTKQLEIYLAKDGLYYGKLISTGKTILNSVTYNDTKKSFIGIMTPPEFNTTVNATITFENKNKLKLIGKKFIMSKTIYFVRIKN